MDIRILPRDFVRQFIELYKSCPCLWKLKHATYNNRRLRDEAYRKMIEFCKESGFAEANRDFVAKKIQSLRGSFRKELRKMQQTDHEPSLWYFDMLTFTVDQEETDANKHNKEARRYFEQDDILDENAASNSNSNAVFFASNASDDGLSDEYDDDNDGDEDSAVLKLSEIVEVDKPKKKRRLSSSTKHSRHKTTEFEAIGVNVARKLERMDPRQALYAESIINAVLKRGLLKKLKDTDGCDGDCRFFGDAAMTANPLDMDGLEMKRESRI